MSQPHLIHPKYRPDIDGLRAVAILSVVLFHAFPQSMSGGFVGVDVFFVISGYLISTIVFSSLERDRFSILEFYERRIRRIFPALFVVMFASFLFGWLFLYADEYEQLGKHLAAGAGFVSNFILWRESGYFDNLAETKPLLHLWSLAVEEQFYVFWPLLLAFVWKRNWSFLKITAAIAVISFASNLYLMNQHPVAAFYLPFSRFWELMAGGILAYVTLHRPGLNGSHRNAQSILGFSLLFAALLLLDKSRDFPGWWAMLPTLGAFFIISAGPDALLNRKILSNPLMLWIGWISYPLYLWHWPLLSFARIVEGEHVSGKMTVLAIVAAFGLAWLTFAFVEKPFRFAMRKGQAVVMLLFLMAGILGLGGLSASGMILQRIHGPSIDRILEAESDWGFPDEFSSFHFGREIFHRIGSPSRDAEVFLGDSHADQYSPMIAHWMKQGNSDTVYFVTHEGCLPIPGIFEKNSGRGECDAYRKSMKEFLNGRTDIGTVIVGACWSCYFIRDNGASRWGGESVSQPAMKKMAMEKLASFLVSLGRNHRVFLLLDNPTGAIFDPRHYLEGGRFSGVSAISLPGAMQVPEEQIELRRELTDLAKSANAGIIDPFDILCGKDGHCMVSGRNGDPVYIDTNHLRAAFVREHADFMERIVSGR